MMGQRGTRRTATPAPLSPLPASTSPDPTRAAGAKLRNLPGAHSRASGPGGGRGPGESRPRPPR